MGSMPRRRAARCDEGVKGGKSLDGRVVVSVRACRALAALWCASWLTLVAIFLTP